MSVHIHQEFLTNYLICEVMRMQICQKCYIPMVGIMSFSKDKRERFYQCPKCKGETQHNALRNTELDFETILRNECAKQK